MNRLLAPMLAAFWVSGAAWAADALAVARSGTSAAQIRVDQIQVRQAALQTQMDQLSARITALKSQQRGALLPGSELSDALRRSQELSGALSEAAKALSGARTEAEQDQAMLVGQLSRALEELKGRWDNASREERQGLLTQMRALRSEREQLRARLPAAAVPALGTPASDDPTELLEQADALRDSEDKVRHRMEQIQGRLKDLKEERELDRRMNAFLGQEAIFDEQDRRLRGSLDQESLQSGRSNSIASGGMNPQGLGGAAPSGNSVPGPNTFSSQSARAEDARPDVGGVTKGAAEGDDLKSLEAQLQQLGAAAGQLEQKAHELEARARQLQ
jgi:uncharacterized coiled-coil DUF342 family protein